MTLFYRRQGIDIHPSSRSVEAHIPIDQRENRVVAAEPYILARQEFRSALPDNDVASDDQLTSKFFNAQPLADAIAPVLYATLSFFVSHNYSVSFFVLFFALRLIDLILSRVSFRRWPTVR
jgi:hypothetical protein